MRQDEFCPICETQVDKSAGRDGKWVVAGGVGESSAVAIERKTGQVILYCFNCSTLSVVIQCSDQYGVVADADEVVQLGEAKNITTGTVDRISLSTAPTDCSFLMRPSGRILQHNKYRTDSISCNMPSRFSDAFRQTALFMAEIGASVDQIAKELGCCTKTVKRIKRNYKLWQSHQAPSERPLGRPPKIGDAMTDDLLEHLLRHPSADLEEMSPSYTTNPVSLLVLLIHKNAAERSQALRDDWLLRLSDWTAEQLMFVDQSAANEKTGHRKYGWAPVGVIPDETESFTAFIRDEVLPRSSP
ncbi:hypothetical protein V1525DRAFT_390669 [Lipomyces kononenkoae]|uniref:Uncharacterized protein n=1 Tax=Lipomyces kononenkoae TaxID=34357 RepID=A0ACC3SU94_LIPKO